MNTQELRKEIINCFIENMRRNGLHINNDGSHDYIGLQSTLIDEVYKCVSYDPGSPQMAETYSYLKFICQGIYEMKGYVGDSLSILELKKSKLKIKKIETEYVDRNIVFFQAVFDSITKAFWKSRQFYKETIL